MLSKLKIELFVALSVIELSSLRNKINVKKFSHETKIEKRITRDLQEEQTRMDTIELFQDHFGIKSVSVKF